MFEILYWGTFLTCALFLVVAGFNIVKPGMTFTDDLATVLFFLMFGMFGAWAYWIFFGGELNGMV